MGSWFSKAKKKESRVTPQDKAILQLKQQRDRLKQYQKNIQLNLEKERLVAKKMLQEGRKEKVKLLLRKKRFMEQMLSKTDVQLLNLEEMAQNLEFAQIEIQVVEGLKTGNESLKTLHEMMSVEEIEKIMDETAEGIEKQQELDELLSGKLTDEDEEAVLKELESIVAENALEAGKEFNPEIETTLPEKELDLPDVPKAAIGEPKKKVPKADHRQKVAAT